MGTITPNIGLYLPVNGETNYADAFASGMLNLDAHDHTGGPNKGVPITSSGLADFSVTYNKLASNVADTTTGIGTNGSMPNQLIILGVLKSLYILGGVPGVGFVSMNGTIVSARTFQGTTNQIAITNPDGVAGVPVFSLSPVVVNSTQPAFDYSPSVQNLVTGDGTVYKVNFTISEFQQGSGYDGTNTFTAPVTGVYLINADVGITGLLNTHTTGVVQVAVGGTPVSSGVNGNVGAMKNASGGLEMTVTSIQKLTAGNQVTILLQVSNGTKVVNVVAGDFSVALLY